METPSETCHCAPPLLRVPAFFRPITGTSVNFGVRASRIPPHPDPPPQGGKDRRQTLAAGFRARATLWASLTLLSLWAANPAHAHPVPSRLHDRAVVVRLTMDAVVVDYRLDIDEFTVVFLDLPAVMDASKLARLTT